jgi:hypothetical protein
MSDFSIPTTMRFVYGPVLPAALTAIAKGLLEELARPEEERSAIFSIRMYGYVHGIPGVLNALHEEREHPESVTAAKELLAVLPRTQSYLQRLEELAQSPKGTDLYTSVHQSLTNFLAQPTPNPTNAAP